MPLIYRKDLPDSVITLSLSGGAAGVGSVSGEDSHYVISAEIEKVSGRRFVTTDLEGLDDYFPWLTVMAPLQNCHAETGEPLYALDNGWYWAGGSSMNGEGADQPPNAAILQRTLRIPLDVAQGIVVNVMAGVLAQDQFNALVDRFVRPLWRRDAMTGKSMVEDLVRQYRPPPSAADRNDMSPQTIIPQAFVMPMMAMAA